MLYQIINVNEVAKVVPLFRGDYSNNEEPADWFAAFQLSLPSTWSDAMKVDRFAMQLVVGSYADKWFMDLMLREKADLSMLKAAFLKRWPPVKRPKWTKMQQRERIRALRLEEDEIGKWVQTEGGGDYGHVVWATKVMRMALSMGDVDGKLIEYAIEEAPSSLRNELEDEYEDWEEFVEAVRKILEKVVAVPHHTNTEAGRWLYEADVQAWHQAYGEETMLSLERPYPLKPGTVRVGSGECFNCGLVTDPLHIGSTCTAKETLWPHETRWRQLVASMLRRVSQVRVNVTPVQYIWPMTHQEDAVGETNNSQVYAVATGEEWHAGGAELGDQQENAWGWMVEGNY
ncbi:hypothetical protein PISMIDRAFT_29855 [Pisolithus microcarpus 441]|uniref:Uncharacterized protein n=1 Tax=Pisolithus microcarpus 441 TaxID=765257 RepID=A0A0C9YXU9_9AGAM|nr:hypothetical protein BKA83DRAFT_29855 [Pisolithus microcarpus]KIK21576.1 hypothetical protein PISMIDRAFT_29855 [Pisolithus microcarpus 441]